MIKINQIMFANICSLNAESLNIYLNTLCDFCDVTNLKKRRNTYMSLIKNQS